MKCLNFLILLFCPPFFEQDDSKKFWMDFPEILEMGSPLYGEDSTRFILCSWENFGFHTLFNNITMAFSQAA